MAKVKKSQYGSSVSQDKSGKYNVVTKANTKEGPRYYQATNTNENTARMLNNARARANSADSTRAKDINPIDLKNLANQKKGGKTSKVKAKDGKWIQKAVNPKHKGYCTPMTKATCTPKRKALAKTFKAMGRARKGK
jgi:hypothetical protein